MPERDAEMLGVPVWRFDLGMEHGGWAYAPGFMGDAARVQNETIFDYNRTVAALNLSIALRKLDAAIGGGRNG